jgi:heptosyltransferase-2
MQREFRRVESVLIKLPNWIGDIVMSIPAVRYVRRVFPEARLKVIVKQQLADLVADDPDIDGMLTYGMRRGPARLIDEFRIIRRIRREYANLAVIFPYSVSSALWTFLAGIPLRLGSAVRWRGLVLTHAVSPKARDEHQRDYFLRMVRRLGTRNLTPAPHIGIARPAGAGADALLRRLNITGSPALVGIHPGAAYGPAKRWFPGRFAELAGRLSGEGIRVLVFGAPPDGPVVDEIVAQAGDSVTNLCGQLSLGEFAALLAKCDVVVANDSGPMHLAGAVGAKVVAIFGSTSPRATSPSGQCRVIWKDIDCSPCFRRDCPHQYRCLELVSVDEVYSAVKEFLEHGDRA